MNKPLLQKIDERTQLEAIGSQRGINSAASSEQSMEQSQSKAAAFAFCPKIDASIFNQANKGTFYGTMNTTFMTESQVDNPEQIQRLP